MAQTKSPVRLVLQKSPSTLARKNADGNWSILHIETDDFFYTIDGIAGQVWEMIDGKLSVEEIGERLEKKLKLPPKFKKDLEKLVKDLLKEQLVIAP